MPGAANLEPGHNYYSVLDLFNSTPSENAPYPHGVPSATSLISHECNPHTHTHTHPATPTHRMQDLHGLLVFLRVDPLQVRGGGGGGEIVYVCVCVCVGGGGEVPEPNDNTSFLKSPPSHGNAR